MSRDQNVPSDLEEYTSFGSPINLYTARNRWAATIQAVTGSGSLVVTMAGSKGVQRTVTFAAGEKVDGQFMSIDSSTGITRVRVGWN